MSPHEPPKYRPLPSSWLDYRNLVGQCWGNAPVESFFASLQRELVHSEQYTTREQARASIFEYVEAFYNRVRRHSFPGFLSPEAFERAYHQNHP